MTEKVTSQDGTSIAFERSGTGPPLVMVDAASCFRGFGPTAPLAAALTPHFTVFHYDRRGRGESTDTLPYAVHREIEDLAAVIDAAGGSAFAYGFSSGAVLALHAAAAGLPIPRLALLEPPVILDDSPAEPDPLAAEVTDLVTAGRRGDAILHFNRTIGVPEELLTGMRDAPYWPSLEALAHTLVYDTMITSSLSRSTVSAIPTPCLVIDSTASDNRLRTWAQDVAITLPNARHLSLPGEWHGPTVSSLVPAITQFLTGQGSR